MRYETDFVPQLATLLASMDALIQAKGKPADLVTPVKWTDLTLRNFITLQQRLHNLTLLHTIIPNKPIILQTDASDWAPGATILQEDVNSNRQPIAYFSQNSNNSERNRGAFGRELRAAVKALLRFQHLLYGKEILWETDHKALADIQKTKLNTKNIPPTWAWDLNKILQFNIEVKHLPGIDLIVPDALSRLQCNQIEEELLQPDPPTLQELKQDILANTKDSSTLTSTIH